MAAGLTKSVCLLEKDEDADSTFGGFVSFGRPVGEDSGLTVGALWLSRDAWEDMGSPSEITTTVEPGDRLN